MRAVGFFYDWSGRRTLDAYFGQVAQSFAALGIELDIVLGNELVHPAGGQETRNPLVDEAKLIAFVAARAPDFVFSVNNAGMSARLQASLTVPIVKWFVDDAPHLFWPGGRAAETFGNGERIVCYSSTLAAQIEADFPQSRGRVSWVSHGTNQAGSHAVACGADYPISFIGSALDVRPLIRLLVAARERGAAEEVLSNLSDLRADYVAASRACDPTSALHAALADVGMTRLDYQRVLADAVTTQDRTEGLRRIADLGLSLFGNERWLESLSCTADLADRFRFDAAIATPAQLQDAYARSRISINIPNVQNCAGLAARVFDVMASPSLLITAHHPHSDLFALFGPDCPVPTYRDFDHLRELCAYYLAHEDERLRVVAECNRLVGERFLVQNRLREMLASAEISIPANPAPARPPRIARAGAFHGLPTERSGVGPWAKLVAKTAAKRVLGPAAEPVRRYFGGRN